MFWWSSWNFHNFPELGFVHFVSLATSFQIYRLCIDFTDALMVKNISMADLGEVFVWLPWVGLSSSNSSCKSLEIDLLKYLWRCLLRLEGFCCSKGWVVRKENGDLNKGCYIQIASQRWSNRRSRIRKLLRQRRRTIWILPSDLEGFTWFNGDKFVANGEPFFVGKDVGL